MASAKNSDRQKAYRLRDEKARGRRTLSPSERAWLELYDREHPPRGPRKKAQLRGAPIEPDVDEAPALRVETIPTARVADAAPPPPLEGEGEHAPVTPEVIADPSAPPPLGAFAAESTAEPTPEAPPSQFSRAALAAGGALFVVSKLCNIARAAGVEPKDEYVNNGLVAMTGATLNCLNKYLPQSVGVGYEDEALVLLGYGTALGEPKIVAWLEKKRDEAEDVRRNVVDAPPPQVQQAPASVPPTRSDATDSGYE